MQSFRKVLIIQTAFIGDVVLVTPLIRAVRQALPDSELHVMIIPAVRNLIETNPHVDELVVFDKRNRDSGWRGLARVIKNIRSQKYDLLLVPHRSIKSALIARLSGAGVRVGFSNSSGAYLYKVRVPYRQDIHEVERNLSLLRAVGFSVQSTGPEVFADDHDRQIVDHLLQNHKISTDDKIVALAPGSVWATKRWPKEYFTELIGLLAATPGRLLLLGGEKDRALCDEIASSSNGAAIFVAGQLSLRQSAELLRRCQVLISNDSAPMHLASAAGTPVVALFGPTIPAFGFYPYGEQHTVIEKELACRPCGIHGGRRCPLNTHQCMKDLLPQQVFQVLKRYSSQDEAHVQNH